MQETLELVGKIRKALDAVVVNKERQLHLINEISKLYTINPREGGLIFNYDALNTYLEDYFVRDIYAADRFLVMAFCEDYPNFMQTLEKKYPGNNEINVVGVSEKKKQLLEYLNASRDAWVTLSDPYYTVLNKKDTIPFRLSDILGYIGDWINGNLSARLYIVRAIRADVNEFLTAIDELVRTKQSRNANKVINGMIEELSSNDEWEDKKFITRLKYKQGIIEKNVPQIVESLQKALFYGVLETTFTHLKDFYELENLTILRAIENPNLLHEIHALLSDKGRYRIGRSLFESFFEESNQREGTKKAIIDTLVKLKPIATKNEEDIKPIQLNNRTIIKFNEDITIDYYLASLKQDVETMIDLGKNKNKEMFKRLFTYEMEVIDSLKLNDWQDRLDFYKVLMGKPDMRLYDYYNDCLNLLGLVFKEAGIPFSLEPVESSNLVLQLGSLLQLEDLKVEDDAGEMAEFVTPTRPQIQTIPQVMPRLFAFGLLQKSPTSGPDEQNNNDTVMHATINTKKSVLSPFTFLKSKPNNKANDNSERELDVLSSNNNNNNNNNNNEDVTYQVPEWKY